MNFPPLLWEAINVLLSSLGACLVFIFARYLLSEMVEHGFQRTRLRAGIGLFVLASGEATTRSWAAIGRHIENRGGDVTWMMNSLWGFTPMLGAIVSAVGMLCLIRVFSPDEWGRWGWVVCAGIALTTTTVALWV